MTYTNYDEYKAFIKTKVCDDVSDYIIDGVLSYVFSIVPLKATRMEYCDGNGTPKLFLKYYPIDRTIPPVVSIDEESITDFQVVSGQGFLLRKSGVRPRGYENVEVSYTAGYNPLPGDVEQIIIDMINTHHTQSQTVGISSESVDDYRVVFDKGQSAHIQSVLDKYKGYYV